MKIFINCGSQPIPFYRLWNYARELSKNKELDIFYQGYDHSNSSSADIMFNGNKFLEKEVYMRRLGQADIAICHAGSGAIFDSIKLGHKPYVLPRLRKFGEHNDDHQLELFNLCCEEKIVMELDISNFLLTSTRDPENLSQSKSFFNGNLTKTLHSLLKEYTN